MIDGGFRMDLDLDSYQRDVARRGYVVEVRGIMIRAAVPETVIGDVCRIEVKKSGGLLAEVVGFDRDEVLLIPYGPVTGIEPRAPLSTCPDLGRVPCGDRVRGRVLDALGRPWEDADAELPPGDTTALISPPPNPMRRKRIDAPIETGVRAVDGLLTIGRGQRVGIFAAAGCGKSTLLGMIARHIEADRVVLALIGERGREVRDFLEENLGDEGRRKTTVVVSTSDQAAPMRLRAAHAATAIAEDARRRGERVVLLMDSVTRFARALRDIGLAAGEPPGRQGFPPSVFANLPALLERAGTDDKGSITAFYTVLVAGDDISEPIADETMSLLDGHIVLSRSIAAMNRYPAIDVTASKSRLMQAIVQKDHAQAAAWAGSVLSHYDRNYDKISLGLYKPKSRDEQALVDAHPEVVAFLKQEIDEHADASTTRRRLAELSGKRR